MSDENTNTNDAHAKPCPHCGYCPTCGRANSPWYIRYFQGTWPAQPVIYTQPSGGNFSTSWGNSTS